MVLKTVYVTERILFSELLGGLICCIKNVGERYTAKGYGFFSLLAVIFFYKLVNMRFDLSIYVVFFVIFSIVSTFLVQHKIF